MCETLLVFAFVGARGAYKVLWGGPKQSPPFPCSSLAAAGLSGTALVNSTIGFL